MQPRHTLTILVILVALSAALFLFYQLPGGAVAYILERRAIKLAALIVTAVAIAISTSIFQTVSGNRILTPSILGLDTLYLLVQTLLMFLLGAKSLAMMGRISDFLLSVAVMIVFSLALFSLLFGKHTMSLTMVLFLGMVFGQLFGALASFFQLLIDPNEFLTVQARMFASFNSVNSALLFSSSVIVAAIACALVFFLDILDVLSLGRESAITLGVDHRRASRLFLIIVAILTAIATALVGPVTFLGLLVVSLARQIAPTYRHSIILPTSCLLSMLFLIVGQLLFERIFHFNTPISIIINFAGGIYLLSHLILRGTV
ncbi:MAG: iron chelate uptake ABC transporter family permease subunit [Sphaerochaeta sp.]|jgi:iron complex transport system permease protein|nr:iron chelate uptake ABC transporter family permease subunit [Sphaerochaeta sp.]